MAWHRLLLFKLLKIFPIPGFPHFKDSRPYCFINVIMTNNCTIFQLHLSKSGIIIQLNTVCKSWFTLRLLMIMMANHHETSSVVYI